MGENYVEVLAALVDCCRETDDFGAGAYYYEKFEFAVFGKLYVFIIGFHCFATGSK